MGKLQNLVAVQFGWLTVTSRAEQPDGHRLSHWNVICRCGVRFVVRADALTGMKSPKRSCDACRNKRKIASIFTVTEIGRAGTTTRFGKV